MILIFWVVGLVMFIFAQISCLPLSKKSWTSGVDPDRLRIPPSPWYCSGGAWGHFVLEERKSGPPVKFISNDRSMCSTLNFCLKCGTLWLCICKLYGLPPLLQHWPHSSWNFATAFALSSCDVALTLFLSLPIQTSGWGDFLSYYSSWGWLLPPELPDYLVSVKMILKIFSQASLRCM